jgi:hypothetical protein
MRVREKLNPGKAQAKNNIRKEKARRKVGEGGKKEVLPSSQTRRRLG